MANSDCSKILNLIPLYIDNELCKEEHDIVSRHIASCECCKKEFEFLSSITHTAATLEEPDLSADFHTKLMEKAQNRNKENRINRIKLFRTGASAVAAAAVIAFSIVGISNLNGEEIRPSTDLNLPADISGETRTNNAPPEEKAESKVQQPSAKSSAKATPSTKEEALVPDEVIVKEEENTTTYVFSGKTSPLPENSAESQAKSKGVDDMYDSYPPSDNSAAPDGRVAATPEEATELQAITNDENTDATSEAPQFIVAKISLTEENKDAVIQILSSYEKDDTGYIVPDIEDILDKFSELSVEVSTEIENSHSQNYVIIN